MSRFGMLTIVGAVLVLLAPAASRAALDFTSPIDTPSGMEIVVVEAPGCIYCHLFRRDVWPSYLSSQRAKTVPMKFIDLNSAAAGDLQLLGPIESVPTVLVVLRGHELGRIPGYIGPESFFHSIDRLLAADH